MGARDILLLAAEDAFEFERWRESGPVTSEIDPETAAAEIVEYEALAIPLPRELDTLRRELEFSPVVREAIRSASGVLRRNGRAEASALVRLGPQNLMPWGSRGIDPRILMMMDPRMGPVAEPAFERVSSRGATVEVESVEPSHLGRGRVMDLPEEADDDFDQVQASPGRRAEPARSRASASRSGPAWDEDDSLIGVRARPGQDRTNTIILGIVSMVAVVALLWIAFGDPKRDEEKVAAVPAAQPAPAPAPVQQVQSEPVPAVAAIDPALTPAPTPAPAYRGSGGSRSAPVGVASKPVNPFATYDANVAAGEPAPPAAAGAAVPAAPVEGAPAPAPAPVEGTLPADAAAVPTEAAPAPAPVEAPPPPPIELTKSKMTPPIRDAITSKVGELQRCYDEALVGKPDLEGRVLFTISIDQDGIVKQVDIGKDAVGYGVAKCAAKKIRKWSLPSAGIPIIFDLPFDFQQPKG